MLLQCLSWSWSENCENKKISFNQLSVSVHLIEAARSAPVQTRVTYFSISISISTSLHPPRLGNAVNVLVARFVGLVFHCTVRSSTQQKVHCNSRVWRWYMPQLFVAKLTKTTQFDSTCFPTPARRYKSWRNAIIWLPVFRPRMIQNKNISTWWTSADIWRHHHHYSQICI